MLHRPERTSPQPLSGQYSRHSRLYATNRVHDPCCWHLTSPLQTRGGSSRSSSSSLTLRETLTSTVLRPTRPLGVWVPREVETHSWPTSVSTPGAWGPSEVLASATVHAGVQVGGEHAAAILTRHLKPATLTLHVLPGEGGALAARLKLARTSDHATVFFLDRFDTSSAGISHRRAAKTNGENLAHPILVRAELLALDDDRLREVAERLRKSILADSG